MKFSVCQMCGKEYFKRPGSIYHITFAGKVYNFCCHSCYRLAEQCKDHIIATSHEKDYVRFQSELRRMAEAIDV